jgi:septal ring factor EnvC (AmiA/AmiB activator)
MYRMASHTPNNRGGRPAHYTLEQVSTAIERLLSSGCSTDEICAKTVKPHLTEYFGVSRGIRDDALERAVEQILKARTEAEHRALLKALPDSVPSDVDTVLQHVRTEILLLIAQQNAVCEGLAEKAVDELRTDKRNAHWRIAELETKIEDQAHEIETLVADRDRVGAELESARDEVRRLKSELDGFEKDAIAVDRLLAALRAPDVQSDLRAALTEIVDPAPGSGPTP